MSDLVAEVVLLVFFGALIALLAGTRSEDCTAGSGSATATAGQNVMGRNPPIPVCLICGCQRTHVVCACRRWTRRHRGSSASRRTASTVAAHGSGGWRRSRRHVAAEIERPGATGARAEGEAWRLATMDARLLYEQEAGQLYTAKLDPLSLWLVVFK